MAKKDEEPKVDQQEIHAPTNREKFNSYMSERIQDFNPDDDEAMYEQVSQYLGGRDEKEKMLTDAIRKDPRMGQLITDIVQGKRSSHNALARYFGKDMLTAKEGTPEYDDIMAAEEERKKDAEAAEESARQYKENIKNSLPVIESYCKEKGIDMDNFMNDAWEKIVYPIMEGVYTTELCEILNKGFSYDTDVKDAMAAGEVKGRNTNINKMRSDNKGDGMPTGMTSENPVQRKKRRTVLDLAAEA